MKRRSFLRAGTAGAVATALPRFSIAQPANARVLRFVPQANLTVLDPIFTTAAVTANHAWMVYDTLFGVNAAQQAEAADGRGLHGLRRRPHLSDQAARWAEMARRRAGARAGLRAEPGALVGARHVRPDRGEGGRQLGRGGRQDDQDHAEEALPAADRRDRRPRQRVHDAGAACEDRSVQGDHRGRRLGSVPFPEGRIRRRQQRRVGEVRRLCAAPGAGGMDLGRQGRPLPAHRVEDHP